MDRKSILDSIHDHKEQLKKIGITRVGLFGSFSRNENTENSDLDLLLEFDPQQKNFHNFMKAYDLLENIFNIRVDIITPESISPYLKKHIESEAVYESTRIPEN